MNQPGLSLFQGAGSLHLNTSAQRLEDEEELLDQQRRREEVQNRLDNEFGDLSDDNDDTNVSEYQHHPPSYPAGNHQQHLQNPIAQHTPFAPHAVATHTNMEKIAPPPAYDERVDLLAKFKADQNIEELKRRLAICESEKQRAFMARQQSHELLVESKGKISDQEDTIVKLKTKLKAIEHTNTDLVTQLECKQTLLNDALLKQQMIERNVGLSADRNADLAIKQANDRATAQAAMHQQQLDSMRTQLDERQHELRTLQSRYTELQRSREALLVEKSETINQLSKSIEDSQRHNLQLMAASRNDDAGYEECVRLRSQVDQMCAQIGQLERSLQTANTELNTMTSLLHESTASCDAANQMLRTTQASVVQQPTNSSTPILQDTTSRLRSELSRCLADQKERRAELQLMQQQLTERDADIKALKTDENRLLVELETLKAEAQRSATQLKHLSGDLQRVFRLHGHADAVSSASADKVIDAIQLAYERSMDEHSERCAELQRVQADRQLLEQRLADIAAQRSDVDSELSQALRQAQAECKTVRGKYAELLAAKVLLTNELEELRACDVRHEFRTQSLKLAAVERTLHAANDKCQRMDGELTEMRESYEAKMQALTDRLQACDADNANIVAEKDKADIELKQLRNDCINYRTEITALNTQLQQYTDTIADLRHSVALRHDNDQLLADLQAKAQRFDQYIHQQQLQQHTPPTLPSTPNQPLRTPERCASAPNHQSVYEPDSPADRRLADETRMAAVLAKKLKAVEDTANAEQQQLRQALHQLDMQLNYTRDTLEIRSGEVQLLKQAILSERTSVKQMMEERDAEVGELFEKQQCVLDKYRERLDVAQDTIQRLNERIAALQVERRGLLEARDRLVLDSERLKAERDRHDGDREAWQQREAEWRQRLDDVERSRAAQSAEWERKYRAAKKSAASYKQYAEDKDAHIQRENKRIRAEYKRTIEKIQGNVENIVLNK